MRVRGRTGGVLVNKGVLHVYYWCGGGRGRREGENIFHKHDMMGHKDFIEDRVKTEKGTLSE